MKRLDEKEYALDDDRGANGEENVIDNVESRHQASCILPLEREREEVMRRKISKGDDHDEVEEDEEEDGHQERKSRMEKERRGEKRKRGVGREGGREVGGGGEGEGGGCGRMYSEVREDAIEEPCLSEDGRELNRVAKEGEKLPHA